MKMGENDSQNALSDLAVLEIEALAHKSPVTVSMNPMLAFLIITQLQLALRHPGNDGLPAEQAREFIADLRRRITAPGDPIDTLIGMGFVPAFDVDTKRGE